VEAEEGKGFYARYSPGIRSWRWWRRCAHRRSRSRAPAGRRDL